ncbi:MAG: hypothetical protein GIW95_04660 [Candidatus Eremiobacteraeota bacterium]|nr:hypothetical protein [Candidatus Eremiobacteraeota bacterium]
MKRLIRSEGYARARLVSGSLFAVLGFVVVVRTAMTAGISLNGLPGYVLGGAMIALCFVRFREYRSWKEGA